MISQKGARWESEIAKELEASRVGLLILTPENIESAWLVFEAGALARNLEKSKVCPILCGLEPTDIKGPLVQFQSARFNAPEMKRVVKMINGELGENGLTADVFEQVFDMWWPRLEAEVVKQLQGHVKPNEGGSRSERDILQEILTLTRSIAKSEPGEAGLGINPLAVEALIEVYANLIEELQKQSYPERFLVLVHELYRPIEYMAERSFAKIGPELVDKLRSRFMELQRLIVKNAS